MGPQVVVGAVLLVLPEASAKWTEDGMVTTPNPGSKEALAQGCICAVLDNNHGMLAPYPPDGWWITAGCPTHTPSGVVGSWTPLAVNVNVTSKGAAHHPSCRDSRTRLTYPPVRRLVDPNDLPEGVWVAKCCRSRLGIKGRGGV